MDTDILYELQIPINEYLSIHYIKTDLIKNIFVNDQDINLITKSAEEISFKGLLNMIAFYDQTENYTFDFEGIVLYRDIININDELYMVLEDTLEYYDDEIDEVIKDYDDEYQLVLYYKNKQGLPDLEVASYYLDEEVVTLFDEIEDFYGNSDYKGKILGIYSFDQPSPSLER
jgi:hypothetical protein